MILFHPDVNILLLNIVKSQAPNHYVNFINHTVAYFRYLKQISYLLQLY